MAALTQGMNDDPDGIKETLEILSNPKLVEELKVALKQIERGEYLTEEECFDDLLHKEI